MATINNSDQRVLALRQVIAQKTKDLGKAPVAKYKSNLTYNTKNVLVMSLADIRVAIADLLVKQQMNSAVNTLLGDTAEFSNSDLLDDLVLRGKLLIHKSKEAELSTLQTKLDNLRSEHLRVADELDSLEDLLS
jgi:hypothetical protein